MDIIIHWIVLTSLLGVQCARPRPDQGDICRRSVLCYTKEKKTRENSDCFYFGKRPNLGPNPMEKDQGVHRGGCCLNITQYWQAALFTACEYCCYKPVSLQCKMYLFIWLLKKVVKEYCNFLCLCYRYKGITDNVKHEILWKLL